MAFERAHLRWQEAEADRATAVAVGDPVDKRREFLTPAFTARMRHKEKRGARPSCVNGL
jgi:hypothetical protein